MTVYCEKKSYKYGYLGLVIMNSIKMSMILHT